MRSSIFFGFLASSLRRQISPASEAWFSVYCWSRQKKLKVILQEDTERNWSICHLSEPLVCFFVHGKSISFCAVLGIHNNHTSHGSCSIRGTSDESLQDPDAPWFVSYLPTSFSINLSHSCNQRQSYAVLPFGAWGKLRQSYAGRSVIFDIGNATFGVTPWTFSTPKRSFLFLCTGGSKWFLGLHIHLDIPEPSSIFQFGYTKWVLLQGIN